MLFEYLKLKYLENPTEGNVAYFISCLENEINTYEANNVRMLSNCFDDIFQNGQTSDLYDYENIDEIFEGLESLAKDIAEIVSKNECTSRDDEVKDLISLLKKDDDYDDEGYISANEGHDPYDDYDE